MPSKFTMQEFILIVINRADVFDIQPVLDLFIQRVIPFASIDEFSASVLAVARYVIGINASRYLPQIQTWAFSHFPVGSRPESKTHTRTEQQFDQEIETLSLFVGIALLCKKPGHSDFSAKVSSF
jgi:hypothetical protein